MSVCPCGPRQDKFSEAGVAGMQYISFLAKEFGGNEMLLQKALDAGQVKKTYKDDGSMWLWHASERKVHRQGHREGTSGSGSKRQVEDADVEMMARLLNEAGWGFKELSAKQEKKLEDGTIPADMKTSLNAAFMSCQGPHFADL